MYETILDRALSANIKLIHLGADLLPKGSGIFEIQKKFINGYLKNWYDKCREKGIQVLAFFGNDDIYTRKKYFKKYGSLLNDSPVLVDGYEFKAYPYVLDYPYGLKTACKWDSEHWRCPDQYISNPVDVDEKGWRNIYDIDKYFQEKGTIENDLNSNHAIRKTIMAIHQPPSGMSLDVCRDGRKVGSEAVRNWIQVEQPLLVLCGHIHESYQVTGIWDRILGSTVVIQPGQFDPKNKKIRIVYISIEEDVKIKLIETPTII